MTWVVFHCVYIPRLLNAFSCWWTFRSFPCLGYCECCCSEHSYGCMHLLQRIFCPDRCPGVRVLDPVVVLYFIFWSTSILFFIVIVPVYIPTNSGGGYPLTVELYMYLNSFTSEMYWRVPGFNKPWSFLFYPDQHNVWILGRACQTLCGGDVWNKHLSILDYNLQTWWQLKEVKLRREGVGNPRWGIIISVNFQSRKSVM